MRCRLLVRLARGGALDISMEAVILNERWPGFDVDDHELARWRLDEAKRMAAAGELPIEDY